MAIQEQLSRQGNDVFVDFAFLRHLGIGSLFDEVWFLKREQEKRVKGVLARKHQQGLAEGTLLKIFGMLNRLQMIDTEDSNGAVQLVNDSSLERFYSQIDAQLQKGHDNPNSQDREDRNGEKGGIDLTRDKMGLQVRGAGEGVQFEFDPAMIRQLHNAAGLTPVIIDISPMTTSVPMFLGLRDSPEKTAPAR